MNNLVAQVFRNPEYIKRYSLQDWDLLVRQTRASGLMAKLYTLLSNNELLDAVPEGPRRHLNSSRTQSLRHSELVHYEIKRIHKALAELETPVILLKGAAYVAAGLSAGDGRFFSDIDIMVHKSRIDLAEDALQHHGWINSDADEYDEKYYRTWMHEIPPMQHRKRMTALDLHHSILPQTSRYKLDANKLFKTLVPVEGYERLYTLCPEDMVLHSATHLFSEGEFDLGLRDLIDIDNLLRHFPDQNPKFWQRLTGRARNLDLTKPLYYALHYCRTILDTPIPDQTYQEATQQAEVTGISGAWVHQLLQQGLQPSHSSCRRPFNDLLMWMLYVRSHYLRMPFKLLVPHLLHKAVVTPYHERAKEKEAAKHLDIHALLALRNR